MDSGTRFNPLTAGPEPHRTGLRMLPEVHGRSDLSLLKFEKSSHPRPDQLPERRRNPILHDTGPAPHASVRPVRPVKDNVSALLDPARAAPVRNENRSSTTPNVTALPMLEDQSRRTAAAQAFNYKKDTQAKYASMFESALDASRDSRQTYAQLRARERTSNQVFYMPSGVTSKFALPLI